MVKIFKDRLLVMKIIVVVFHLVGLIGMTVPALKPLFQLLTPFHLLICTFILLSFHRDWGKAFQIFVVIAFTVGFSSEVLGVKTGFPFGDYAYSEVLGFQLFEVPLLIGVNWFLLVYLTGALLQGRVSWYLAAVFGAIMMVGLDILIEPVAVKLNFWQWEGAEIPLSNYVAWFVVALIIQIFYHRQKFQKENPLAGVLLMSLVVFFLALNLLL